MNEEQQKEYQEHFSPDGERLQYLMEHPEENESEAFDSSLKKTFDECCEGEEKKEWEFTMYDLRGEWTRDEFKVSILRQINEKLHFLLAKQQEEFVKLLESKYSEPCDCIGEKYNCEHWGRHELLDELLLADIKRQLKI